MVKRAMIVLAVAALAAGCGSSAKTTKPKATAARTDPIVGTYVNAEKGRLEMDSDGRLVALVKSGGGRSYTVAGTWKRQDCSPMAPRPCPVDTVLLTAPRDPEGGGPASAQITKGGLWVDSGSFLAPMFDSTTTTDPPGQTSPPAPRCCYFKRM